MTKITAEPVTLDTDVLVIGGGSAGLFAAIRAKDFCSRVLLADKGIVGSAGISSFIHVVTAPVAEADIEPAMREMVERSTYLCDQPRLSIMLGEIGERVRQSEGWGVPFEKDTDGKLYTAKRMGQKFTACVFVEGREMVLALKRTAEARGVRFLERVMVTDMLTSDGQHPTSGCVVGAVGLNTVTGQFHIIKAKAVVITSGITGAKLHIQYADGVTGDGQAMALRAGCELADIEMDWNAAFSVWNQTFSTGGQAEYMRAGARMLNKSGEDLIEKYASDKSAPTLGRMELCQAAAKEILENRGPVYLDMRHLGEEDIERMRRVLPIAMRAFDDAGINLRKERVEITPIVYHWVGGIKTDLQGGACVPGLYAAGVSAQRGNHSGFVGVPQAYGFVFGYRAGEAAGKFASDGDEAKTRPEQIKLLGNRVFQPLEAGRGPNAARVFRSVHKVTVPLKYSLVKHEKRIATTLAELHRIQNEEIPIMRAANVHELVKANEARNYALLAEAFYRCALERKESRLSHYREDYPFRNDVDWLKWVSVRRGRQGELLAGSEPIRFEELPVKPRRLATVPVTIRIDTNGVT